MRKIILIFSSSVILFCFGTFAGQQVSCTPYQRKITQPNHLMNVTKTFVQMTDGSYGIGVYLTFGQANHYHNESVRGAFFRVNGGTLVRVGDDLFYVTKKSKTRVATHNIFAYPVWQTTPNAMIVTNVQSLDEGAWETYSTSPMLVLK